MAVFLFLDMQKFLEQYANYHINQTESIQNDTLIILPSKRSVVALKNEFIQLDRGLWLPEIIDIVSFIEKLSNLEILNQEQTLLEFYKVYKHLKKDKNPDVFENFHSWASVLINDFNEIDRFLVDTDRFFEHYKALKALNYFGVEKTKMIQSYIAFWEELPQYYSALKSHLLESNLAYQGLAYRKASNNIQKYLDENKRQIRFIGFNALNAAEEHIIKTCLQSGYAKIAWDIDQFYLDEKQHPANVFIKKYQKNWTEFSSYFIKLNNSDYENPKTLKILSSPKNIGQAKSVTHILKNMSQHEIENTALVLADENLLSPILNSLPESIKNINITMGLSLSQSPLSDFFDTIIEHQKLQKNQLDFHMLNSIFKHSLAKKTHIKTSHKVITHLNDKNILNISYDDLIAIKLDDKNILKLMDCLKIHQNPIDFISSLLIYIEFVIHEKSQAFNQYLLAYKNLFLDLKSIFESYPDLGIMALKILFKDKEQAEKLSFKGSQSQGLQIMGMLESRLLDFENVILTSVNEGILPAGKSENSYITYNLKKQYGLPTHTEKDAIYAYHFFRLLQRTQQGFIIYDNDQSGFNKGEKSRFINYLQIFKSPNLILKEEQFSLSTTLESHNLVKIQKTPEIMTKLTSLCEYGLSPTALTTYILNPILFYKRYVLGVKEPKSIDDVINPRDFGSVMHKTIEEFYSQSNSTLSNEMLDDFSKQSKKLLSANFDEIYAENSYQTGLNRIQFETARAYLKRFIGKEKQGLEVSEVKILDIEKSFETLFQTEHHQVKLKGQIDRIDLVGGTLRIIDLKTGKVEPKHLKFKNFEDLTQDYEFSKAFQILFYAFIYSKENEIDNFKAGIISFKNLNSWFMPLEYQKDSSIDKAVLNNFQHQLGLLIDEILDPNIAFKEKETIFDS